MAAILARTNTKSADRVPGARKVRGSLLVTVAKLWIARSAAAWEFDEHEYLGCRGYAMACEAAEDSLEAWEATTGPMPEARYRYQIACGDTARMAQLHGQAVALSGDHIEDPNEYFETRGRRSATCGPQYVKAALSNANHFHPHNVVTWARHHRVALESCVSLQTSASVLRLENVFEAIFYESTFADHFLQSGVYSTL